MHKINFVDICEEVGMKQNRGREKLQEKEVLTNKSKDKEKYIKENVRLAQRANSE